MTARLVGLLDFVPAATPRFARPKHLAPVAALLERTRREPVRAVVSGPPRHGKTVLDEHAIAWRLLEDPTLRIGFSSYAQRFAEKHSAAARSIAERVGVPLDPDSKSKADWRTGVHDGGVWATSVGGSITGEGFDLLLIDDPHKDRAEAESQVLRDRVYDWFTDTAYTRLEPGGSCIVFMARWHEDDLAGRLIRDGWEHLVLPAIDHDGRALWPDRWPLDKLLVIKETIGEYGWASLYQGSPLPRGGALFKDVRFYDELPPAYRIGKGCDLAYTARTRADRSAAIVLYEHEGIYYVVDVRTARVRVPEFVSMLAAIDTVHPGRWLWHTSTTEAGLADLATATAGVIITPERAAADKFTRAQGVAAAWNAGKVRVPRQAPWLDEFVTEIAGFTGVGDRRDDQVDALASAFTSLAGNNVRALIEREQAIARAAMQASPTRWAGSVRTSFTNFGGFGWSGPAREPAPRQPGAQHVSIPNPSGGPPRVQSIPAPPSPPSFGEFGGGGGRNKAGW